MRIEKKAPHRPVLTEKDRMTPAERMAALISGKTPDRVPFSPAALGFCAISAGINLGEFYKEPDKAFSAGLHLMKTFPWMNTRPSYGWADRGAWEFGGKIVWPFGDHDAAPTTFEHLVTAPDQVASLPQPDPLTAGMNPLLARFNELSRNMGFPASLPGGTPTTVTSAVLGIDNLLRWTIHHPDTVHAMQRKATDFIIASAGITLNLYGGENCRVYSGVPVESNQLISENIFEKFCKPYIDEIFSFYLENGLGSAVVHLCGDHRLNLKHWKDIPLPERTVFSIGNEMDIETTAKVLGPEYIVAGNLDSPILQGGTFNEVYLETKRCLDQGKYLPGGFILMPACEFPPHTPPDNVRAIEQALADYGFY